MGADLSGAPSGVEPDLAGGGGKWVFMLGLLRDIGFAALIVAVIAVSAYLIVGTWPVMVAVESGSMEPNMYRGDLVFLQGTSRSDVITYTLGEDSGYRSFGNYGDVIVYAPNGHFDYTPIIHRAMYFVNNGDALPNGEIADYGGYITRGDNNPDYDQISGVKPVKPEWVIGISRFRIPYAGHVRLLFSF